LLFYIKKQPWSVFIVRLCCKCFRVYLIMKLVAQIIVTSHDRMTIV
jgi:hypothetical protein